MYFVQKVIIKILNPLLSCQIQLQYNEAMWWLLEWKHLNYNNDDNNVSIIVNSERLCSALCY